MTATCVRGDEQRHVFLTAAVIAGVTTAVFLLWMIAAIGGARLTDGVDDVGELVAALMAAGACLFAAAHVPSHPARWVFLGASAFAWAAGEAAWTYYDLIRDVQVPFPSLADVGFLAAVPLAVAGLLLFPSTPQRASDRVLGILDGCIIAGSMLFASWVTVLGPLFSQHQGSALKQTLSLAYPASDVIMVSLVIILFARAGTQGRGSLVLVMAGLVAFAVADSAFSYLTAVNSYGNGSFLDTGWVAGYLLIGLGALRAVYTPSTEAHAPRVSTLSLMAPYVPVLAVLMVTAVQIIRGDRLGGVAWIMILSLALLVLGRQLLVLWDRVAFERRHRDGDGSADGSAPTGDHTPAVLVGR
jgi:hypothetical protein